MPDVILRTEELTKKFGGLVAIDKMNLHLMKNEILGLIGPNGAGKTTLIRVVTGTYKADSGRVFFKEDDITNMPPHRICRMGIAKTNQIPRLFPKLTVLENVMIGALYGKEGKKTTSKAREEALYWIEFVGMGSKAHAYGKELQFVESKKVEIARAMATEPDVLLLDEPLSGLIDVEIDDAVEIIKRINSMGVSIIWVEHILRILMRNVMRVIVMNFGKKIADGTPYDVSKNPEVIKSYIGEEEHA
jgi:branched-chain amino acid transport system ATP-binding protein